MFFKKIFVGVIFLLAFQINVNSYHEIKEDFQILEYQNTLMEYSLDHVDVLKMFKDNVSAWIDYDNESPDELDVNLLLKGVVFAALKHEGQFRKGILAPPYIIHPMGVAKSLWLEAGIRDIDILLAALLHDTLEDTQTTAKEIETNFGVHVRAIVEELTDDQSLSSDQKKQKQVEHASSMSYAARIVKLADRLYNVRDLRNISTVTGKEKSLIWAVKLLDVLRGTNDTLERSLEKEINKQLVEIRSMEKIE